MKSVFDHTIAHNPVPHLTFCASLAVGGVFATFENGYFLTGGCKCAWYMRVCVCLYAGASTLVLNRGRCLLAGPMQHPPTLPATPHTPDLSGATVTAAQQLTTAAVAARTLSGTIYVSDAAMQVRVGQRGSTV